MSKKKPEDSGAAEKRVEAERLIRNYPVISKQELKGLLRYIRKDASALDIGMIASNEELQDQYRIFCHDHYIDRLKPINIALSFAAAIALLALLAYAV